MPDPSTVRGLFNINRLLLKREITYRTIRTFQTDKISAKPAHTTGAGPIDSGNHEAAATTGAGPIKPVENEGAREMRNFR